MSCCKKILLTGITVGVLVKAYKKCSLKKCKKNETEASTSEAA